MNLDRQLLFLLASVSVLGAGQAMAQHKSAQPKKSPQSNGKLYPNNSHRVYQLKTLPRAEIAINGKKINCFLMLSDATRMEGFMFVKPTEIAENDGMLFAFPDSRERSFWMHNTVMPLDIAYIGIDKKIVSTSPMKVLDDSSVPSHGAAMYALEMRQGSFKRLGIKAGQTVTIPKTVKGG